ncbi:acyl-CoA dehydrogenase family protein (plasmid) [Streptomyces sp. NBC_00440]|uniref:acyl-CoA dehydrogenase family protein n=1 Tax=unclassified Streptomyces TaxID=2593676 RepID=UPI002E1EFA01|nr:acyl-CoA dehydrogenase family protein [Streptomyces sp. NBC_00963]
MRQPLLEAPGPARAAAVLERLLGDPADPDRTFSHARSAALDDTETFPLEICRELDALGLPRHYVPAAFGGALRGYDEALDLMRVVARRDLTVAIAHGKTFLGAVCVWVAGDPAQARRLGELVADGAVVSWALTERDHGSDLLACEVMAEPLPDAAGGYRLTGEKWLINNASRGRLLCVLARTSPEAGSRGFSVLLVDKHQLPPGRHHSLPGPPLHGIRGADISGIAFDGAEVPASALVGKAGEGVETVLKSLQLTRTLCSSLSLGAADQALGMAVQYTAERQNYGRPLIDLPQTRQLVTDSYAELLLAEATALVTTRSIHTLPGELAVLSAAAKSFVPTLVDGSIRRLAKVMGSRALLAGDTHRHGRFQKVQRDHRVVGIFDGSTVVNLQALIAHFPALARGYRRRAVDAPGLAAACDPAAGLPAFDRTRLELLSRRGCSPVQAVPAAVEELRALAGDGTVPASLVELAARWQTFIEELVDRLSEQRPTASATPARAFALAERYSACVAASAALHLWLRGRHLAPQGTAALWDSGLWLESALSGLLHRLAPQLQGPCPDEVAERLVSVLLAGSRGGTLPSLMPSSPREATR